MKKVLWVDIYPSPYRVDFYNQLGKYCDLTVVFEKATSHERDKSWANYKFETFKGIILKSKKIYKTHVFCPEVKKYLSSGEYDQILVGYIHSLTALYSMRYMKRKKIPFTFEGDGGFPGSGKGFKERLKKSLISAAEEWYSSSKLFDEYCLLYGAKKDKVYRYHFSSYHDEDVLEKPLTKEEKLEIREKLGIKEEKVILSVGRFIYCKGYDLMLPACAALGGNVGVYIVGGEPTEEYLELVKKHNLKNVHFVSFLSKEEVAEYYKMADLFALATRDDTWGLVVNESMAYGLPVITTSGAVAGTELVNDETGKLIPPNDGEALEKAMVELIENDELREPMAEKCLETARKYTIEKMVEDHVKLMGLKKD